MMQYIDNELFIHTFLGTDTVNTDNKYLDCNGVVGVLTVLALF